MDVETSEHEYLYNFNNRMFAVFTRVGTIAKQMEDDDEENTWKTDTNSWPRRIRRLIKGNHVGSITQKRYKDTPAFNELIDVMKINKILAPFLVFLRIESGYMGKDKIGCYMIALKNIYASCSERCYRYFFVENKINKFNYGIYDENEATKIHIPRGIDLSNGLIIWCFLTDTPYESEDQEK